jgi:hypothetical protein
LRTLIPGQTYDEELDRGGVGMLTCGFTAPCGRTDVIVLQHPLGTVTDDQGRFRIEGLPSGEPLTISAWHPLLEETSEKIVLSPGETKQLDLVVRPVSREIPVVVEEGTVPEGDKPPVAPKKAAKKGGPAEPADAPKPAPQ